MDVDESETRDFVSDALASSLCESVNTFTQISGGTFSGNTLTSVFIKVCNADGTLTLGFIGFISEDDSRSEGPESETGSFAH